MSAENIFNLWRTGKRYAVGSGPLVHIEVPKSSAEIELAREHEAWKARYDAAKKESIEAGLAFWHGPEGCCTCHHY